MGEVEITQCCGAGLPFPCRSKKQTRQDKARKALPSGTEDVLCSPNAFEGASHCVHQP